MTGGYTGSAVREPVFEGEVAASVVVGGLVIPVGTLLQVAR